MTPKMPSGEDYTCVICFGEEGACDVYFSPCSHKACRACVMKLRIATVYKADKGVRCPICRQVIDGYRDAPAEIETPTEDTSWVEKPFYEDKSQIQNLYGRKGITSIAYGNDYIPPKGSTGGMKMTFRQDELYPGYIVPPLKPDSDVLAMAMDKTGARHLDHMLREGYVKRHKVAKICRDMLTPFAAKLAMHGSANFVLQRMLDYAAEHRNDAGNSECFFTAIVRSLCRDNGLVLASQDQRGTFSVQKMLLLIQGAEDLKLVLKGVTGSVAMLSLHQYGVYVIQRLVEAMITSLNTSPGQKPRVPSTEAVKGLALVSAEMTVSHHITSIGLHQVSGPMLVECVRWSLPETQALEAAIAVAAQSQQLIVTRFGHRTLQGMLSLEVKQVAESIIDALQGKFLTLALDSWGWKVVRSCMATRCVSESSRLLVVDELLNSLNDPSTDVALTDTQYGCETLAFCFSVLSRRSLDIRLDKLEYYISAPKFQKFKNSVEGMRVSLLVEPSATPQIRTEEIAFDPWTDDEPSSAQVKKTMSNGSLSELSVEATSDWEQLANTSDDAESSSRAYTPPRHDPPSDLSFPVESVDSKPLLPLPPAPVVKPGTYAPPHVRQALQLHSQLATTVVDQQASKVHQSYQQSSKECSSASVQQPSQQPSKEYPRAVQDPYQSVAVQQPSKEYQQAYMEYPTAFQQSTRELQQQYTVYPSASQQHPYNDFPSVVQQQYNEHLGRKPAGAVGVIGGQRGGASGQTQRSSCFLCKTRSVNAVLLDCSHMCCCLACSYNIVYCPVCQSSVRQVVEVKPFSTSDGLSAPPAPPQVNSTAYLSATDLLPSDLFQTVTLNCELPGNPVSDAASIVSRTRTDYSTSSTSSSNDPGTYNGTLNFTQLQELSLVNKKVMARPRGPYRPPDVFR